MLLLLLLMMMIIIMIVVMITVVHVIVKIGERLHQFTVAVGTLHFHAGVRRADVTGRRHVTR